MPPKVETTYEAVWSYETGQGPRTVRHEFKTKLKEGAGEKEARRSFKRFVIRHRLNRNLEVHDLEIKTVNGTAIPAHGRAPSTGGVYTIEFRILYECTVYKGKDLVEMEGRSGVQQHIRILKNRQEVDRLVVDEMQEWRRKVEAGEILLGNTEDELTDKPLEPIELTVDALDPDRLDAVEARDVVRRMRMKKSKAERIFTTRDNGDKGTVSMVLEDVCVLNYLLEEGKKWAEGSKGKARDGSPRARGWKTGYPETVLDMAKWFGLEDPSEGVSIEMLVPFCKQFNYNMYAFDCLGRKLETYKVRDDIEDEGKKRTAERNSVSLVFWIKDEHVYPVLDRGFKTSLIQQNSHRPARQKYKEGDIQAIDPDDESLVAMLQDENVKGLVLLTDNGKESDLKRIYEHIVNATSIHPMAELSPSGIALLRTERLEIRLCEEPKWVQEIARRLEVDYHGQSVTAVGMKALSQIKGTIELSNYSPEVEGIISSREFYRSQVNISVEALCDCGKPVNACDLNTFHEEGHGSSERVRLPSMRILEDGLKDNLLTTVDITNNYPTNAADMPSNFALFTVGDELEEYSLALFAANEARKDEATGTIRGETAPNFYYCEMKRAGETRISPFWHGNGYYDIEVVKNARQHNFPFRITHRLRARKGLANDFFKPFNDLLKQVFDLNNPDEKKMYKAVATRTIGSLGSHKPFTNTLSCTTRDHGMMSYLYWDLLRGYREKKKQADIRVRHSPQFGYAITVFEAKEREGDSRPIHAKIIQRTYCRLYDMFAKVKEWSPEAELVQIRTDAMTFMFPSEDEKARVDVLLGAEQGWKFEPVMKLLKNPTMKRCTERLVRAHKTVPWHEICVESSSHLTPEALLEHPAGALIEGKPGTGKSTVIRHFTKYLDEKKISYDVVAYTNNVARRLEGKTIHSSLGNKSHPFREVVIVDEIYMVNVETMNFLVSYKKKHPSTRFYLFGDYRQLPPVEMFNYDYINGSVLKSLCASEGSSTRVTLQKNHRYGSETESMLDAVWADRKSLVNYQFEIGYSTRCLVPGHTDRKRVNQLQMIDQQKKNSGKAGKGRWVSPAKPSSRSQTMYLHAGLPVISFRATKTLGIQYRNTTFKVHSWEHGHLEGEIFPDSELTTLGKRAHPLSEKARNAKNAITLVGWDFEKDVLDPDTVLRVTYAEFTRYFCPAYAQTVHITQGATIEGDYSIVNHQHFSSVNMLYTALSRCRGMENVKLAEWKRPEVDKSELAQRLEKNIGRIYGGTWSDFIEKTKLPKGYSWYDYGLDLHIDHVKSKEEYRKEGIEDEAIVNHIKNLQVLQMAHNTSKKDSPVVYERAEKQYPALEDSDSDQETESDEETDSEGEIEEEDRCCGR